MSTPSPVASIVIPTYGRPRLLQNCVEKVLAQECSFPFEVTVVDDGGNPPARENLSCDDRRLSVVRVRNGGPAKARNEGIRRSRGQYVAFLDDDCVPEPGWLEAALSAFEPDVTRVHGPVRAAKPASPLAYHFIDTGPLAMNVTANLVVRRAALLAIGGFDEEFPYAAGEDFDLCWRLDRLGRSKFADGAVVVHELIPLTWRKRRSRPRVFTTFFRLYALHPDRLADTGLPGLSWARQAIVKYSPPLWIGLYVTMMPILQLIREARRADWVSLASETAASCANLADSVGLARHYVAAYHYARERGGQPGLGTQVQTGS